MTARAIIRAGDELPAIEIALSATGIVAAALATRDFQPVHHDAERAVSHGNAGILLNTHATAGYLERLVMQWAGPEAFLKSVKFRLGVPSYVGDTLVLRGTVVAPPDTAGVVQIAVTGTNSRGTHVEGDVVVQLA